MPTIRVLELVDRIILRFIDYIVNVQVVFRIQNSIYNLSPPGGYSLAGKTPNLHFGILGSSPNISKILNNQCF